MEQITVFFALFIAAVCSCCCAFQDNEISNEIKLLHEIQPDEKPFSKVIAVKDDLVFIGSSNSFLQLRFSKGSSVEESIKINRVNYTAKKDLVEMCRMFRADGTCVNAVRVLEFVSSESILICGTNVQIPKCTYYNIQNGTFQDVNLKANRWIPDSSDLVTLLSGNGTSHRPLYVTSMKSKIGKFHRTNQKTLETPDGWFEDPEFKAIYEVPEKEYIYLVFNEKSQYFAGEEFVASGGKVNYYSMIGRVCKNDQGGTWKKDTWMTFSKIRLLCPWPGDETATEANLHYDELVTTYQVGTTIYGLFRPSRKWKLSTYAVAEYDTDDIDGYLNGFTFNDTSAHYFHTTAPGNEIAYTGANPFYPAQCPTTNPYKVAGDFENFVSKNILVKAHVKPVDGKPLYVGSDKVNYKFIFVQKFSWTTVIFLLSEDGYMKKIVINADGSATEIFIKRILKNGDTMLSAKLIDKKGYILATTLKKVITVPLAFCKENNNCQTCTRDPHCHWKADLDRIEFTCEMGHSTGQRTCSVAPTTPQQLQAVLRDDQVQISWEKNSTSKDILNIITIILRKTREIVKKHKTAGKRYIVSKSALTAGRVYEVAAASLSGNSVSNDTRESISIDLEMPGIQVKYEGNLFGIEWSSVIGASKYVITVFNARGEKVQEVNYQASPALQTFYYPNAKEGERYSISVTAVSEDNVQSSSTVEISPLPNKTGTHPPITSPTTTSPTTTSPATTSVAYEELDFEVTTREYDTDVYTTAVALESEILQSTAPLQDSTVQNLEFGRSSTFKYAKSHQKPVSRAALNDCVYVTVVLIIFVLLFMISFSGLLHTSLIVIKPGTNRLRDKDGREYRRRFLLLWCKERKTHHPTHHKFGDAVVTSTDA